MAKVKVVNNNLDYNLNREEFTNIASQTIFSFGRFAITSNFDGRRFINYRNKLSSFTTPITLETLDLNEVQSEIVSNKSKNVVLNLDNGKFNSFVRFGSAYEYLRTSVEEIIVKYPGSLYVNNQAVSVGNTTILDFNYDIQQDVTTFKIPVRVGNVDIINNSFGIIYLDGSDVIPDDNELRNLNMSFNEYVIWSNDPNSQDIIAPIVGFTGFTKTTNEYVTIQTKGNPFEGIFPVSATTADIPFHIKPNSTKFEEFRQQLTGYQKYMISSRNDNGFVFEIKEPILLDNGNIEYTNSNLVWTTGDGYNVDFSGIRYRNFLDGLLTIGGKYDAIKTDLIARFLTPTSLKTYDLTEEGKVTKLLRIYGWEFDQLRVFIDSLAYVNKVTYDKKNNAPDQIIGNLAKLFGWEYFSLVNEAELIQNLLTIDEKESDLNEDFLPVEIDIELWRRIIMNTNYFWKTKGTREAIKSMFLMIGIPDAFINITEYVYTVNEKINPNQVTLQPIDFASNTYPFDGNGYPIAPPETNDFYFQMSGNTDSGQAYMNNFRQAGFTLERTVDNKKSWTEEGEITRQHYSTIQYFQKDSKLVLNTKEVDVGLDAARGIEDDVFNYIQIDYSANSTGFTLPVSYVNLSLARTGTQDTFTLPEKYDTAEGDLEVRWNGILLNAPSITGSTVATGTTDLETTKSDYFISGNTFTIPMLSESGITELDGRNVIQVTYIYSGDTNPITGMSVNYVVTRIKPSVTGSTISIPHQIIEDIPKGDIQLTVNGIALTKKTPQFNADYYVDMSNTGQTNIIITNPAVVSYFNDIEKMEKNPYVQVTYVEVSGSTSVEARSEIHRVDSFSGSKFYFNQFANRFVFVLNYRIHKVENVKILVDGIALEPINDYMINPNNSFEIYLPRNIKFGSVISAYYLVGGDEFFDAIIDDIYGLGDITEMSFMEFAELAQRKLINARTRKIITDFKGGWYPALLKIYNEYLKRSDAEGDLQSNAYTFENLFNFLNKYNTFFEKFINQLLSSTIILKKSGLMVRNSMFTRQKFTYKRGVAFNYKSNDKTFNTELNYLGDAGSLFLIPQQATILTPSLNTILGTGTTNSITGTGGNNIVMFESAQNFGLEYRKLGDGIWIDSPSPPYDKSTWDSNNIVVPATPVLTSNSFSPHTISGLDPETAYQYRAFIEINNVRTYGEIRTTTTEAIPLPNPSLQTIQGTAVRTSGSTKPTEYFFSITGTGGNNIVRWEDAETYAVQWRTGTTGTWNTTPMNNNPLTSNSFTNITITGLSASTIYQYRAYMFIDGVQYFGQTRQLTMLGLPQALPDVETGTATSVTTNSMNITGNTITSQNNSNIIDYGIVYTHQASIGLNPANLISGSTSSGVVVLTENTPLPSSFPFNFDVLLTGLPSNTTTWYRAFARNGVGIRHSDVIKTQSTDSPPTPTTRDLNIEIKSTSTNYGVSGSFTIRKWSDSSTIQTVHITNPTPNYYNEFTLPNEDYYVDAISVSLYEFSSETFIAINERQWVVDGSVAPSGEVSPRLTNLLHQITLTITEVPTP